VTEELNPKFSFETLVVGAANRLAVTAARTVAESPGTAYNPLFVYSPTGLGKTHLLMAVGQLAKELVPQVRVEYLTIDEFVEAYNAAVAAGQSEALRSRYAQVEVLLVDDVQFLTHRREMQAELLRITQELQSAGKQIVLTSDSPPSEIEDLDERLLSRFDAGLLVDIAPPDAETRLAILLRRAEERGAVFGDGVLQAVAEFEVPNVRELLGLLNKLVAYQAVSESPITPDGAAELLAGEVRTEVPMTTGPAPALMDPGEREAAPPEARPDEFADFLSDVAHTVEEQVDVWRSKLGKAIMRWEAEGYRTARLEQLLDQDMPIAVERVLRQYERDIERLRSTQATMTKLDAERAEDPIFYDPDCLEEVDQLVQTALQEVGPPPGPSAAWALSSFVGGESNKVAHSAAQAVVAQPGTRYNPLVFAGPTGVGKTHLLHAIGHELAGGPDAVVACLSAQQLIDELVEAIDGERVDAWRTRYRRATAFLLDDAHLLVGKERTQEELFHLFNELFESQRQLVFTMAGVPHEVEGLDDRLISRLEGGLVVNVASPDRELRRAIVVGKLEQDFGAADEELADYLAARPADSIRGVLGLLQRVAVAAEAQGVLPNAALAREMVEGAAPPRPRVSTGVRTSGIMISPSGGVRSREKMVWFWPDPAQRVIEEMT
jgi:chromosomal replication initiator protein DnaA